MRMCVHVYVCVCVPHLLTSDCEQEAMGLSGLCTIPSTSTMLSRVNWLAYLTMPLVTVVSFTNSVTCGCGIVHTVRLSKTAIQFLY